ncbi:MAG: hypothetical protein MUF18_14385 [Fimbriiglobus sp.]|jgi:hypothetical protein|nr:hypothetical protein [Fimbriiglobus sp.]
MTDHPPPRLAWDWVGWWTLVFALNLPVPVMGADLFVRPDGWLGLVGGLAVLFWLGFALCLFRFRVSRSLVWGGAVVAVTQFLPVIQFVCGAIGLDLWEVIGGQALLDGSRDDTRMPGWRGDRNLGAFAVVLFTAHPMFVIAVLIGAAVRWVRGDRPIWFRRRPAIAE